MSTNISLPDGWYFLEDVAELFLGEGYIPEDLENLKRTLRESNLPCAKKLPRIVVHLQSMIDGAKWMAHKDGEKETRKR